CLYRGLVIQFETNANGSSKMAGTTSSNPTFHRSSLVFVDLISRRVTLIQRKMAPPGSVEPDQLIFALSGEGWTQRDIVTLVKNRGFRVSLSTVNLVLYYIGKRLQAKAVGLNSPKRKPLPGS